MPTWLSDNITVNQCQVFQAPSVPQYSILGQFFDFMPFFLFLYCIPIMVTVFQVKNLMDIRHLNL